LNSQAKESDLRVHSLLTQLHFHDINIICGFVFSMTKRCMHGAPHSPQIPPTDKSHHFRCHPFIQRHHKQTAVSNEIAVDNSAPPSQTSATSTNSLRLLGVEIHLCDESQTSATSTLSSRLHASALNYHRCPSNNTIGSTQQSTGMGE
jgi:hypothetical protein